MTEIVYDNWDDVVDEDYDPDDDNDDSQSAHARATLRARLDGKTGIRLLSSSKVTTPTLVVPFVQVGEGDHADAVYAVKRAYARSKSFLRLRQLEAKPGAVKRTWGKEFSKEFGQTKYTKARHQTLGKYFDAYAIALLHSKPAVDPRQLQINQQLGWHTALYNRRMSVLYSQARPSQLGPANLITRADCSGSVAGGCKWAKILPTVDWRYTNTWSQIKLGSRVFDIAAAKVGDVVFYGSPSHEALYLGGGLVWSFGSYPCKILRWNYRNDFNSVRRFLP